MSSTINVILVWAIFSGCMDLTAGQVGLSQSFTAVKSKNGSDLCALGGPSSVMTEVRCVDITESATRRTTRRDANSTPSHLVTMQLYSTARIISRLVVTRAIMVSWYGDIYVNVNIKNWKNSKLTEPFFLTIRLIILYYVDRCNSSECTKKEVGRAIYNLIAFRPLCVWSRRYTFFSSSALDFKVYMWRRHIIRHLSLYYLFIYLL